VPRLTTVIGTSLIGVVAVVMGIGTGITAYRPEWWAFVDAHVSWFAIATGVILLMSIMTQITHSRPAAAPAGSTPVPATA
jgi:hypothetical protein